MCNWDSVTKSPAYILFYEKEGDKNAISKHKEDSKQNIIRDQAILQDIASMEEKKLAEAERRANPMFEFSFNQPKEVKQDDKKKNLDEEGGIGKRAPFKHTRNRLTHLVKMRVFAAKAPTTRTDSTSSNRVADEEGEKGQTATRISASKIAKKLTSPATWTEAQGQALEDLTASNKFMLGKIERQRDAYDLEYDMGKLKKVKKKKVAQKFNFDKQAKKIAKRNEDGQGGNYRGRGGFRGRGRGRGRGGSTSNNRGKSNDK